MRSNKQALRSFTAFIVTWAFLVLTVTGIVLYIVPQGRVAYWVHWALGGLDKEQWGGLHMIFGGLFIGAGILHLWFNWKPFRNYVAERAAGHLAVKRELVTSLLLTVLIAVMAVFSIPPVSWVFDLNDAVKEAWVTRPELEPPFGHAEEASLSGLARRMDIDLAKAQAALAAAGVKVASPRDSLESIARANGITPMEVYGQISHLAETTPPPELAGLTPEQIEVQFAGKGIGRKPLAEVSASVGVAVADALARLRAAGLQADAGDSLRDIAERGGLSPLDVLKVMLLPDYRPGS